LFQEKNVSIKRRMIWLKKLHVACDFDFGRFQSRSVCWTRLLFRLQKQ
jgi:hypothetical protein